MSTCHEYVPPGTDDLLVPCGRVLAWETLAPEGRRPPHLSSRPGPSPHSPAELEALGLEVSARGVRSRLVPAAWRYLGQGDGAWHKPPRLAVQGALWSWDSPQLSGLRGIELAWPGGRPGHLLVQAALRPIGVPTYPVEMVPKQVHGHLSLTAHPDLRLRARIVRLSARIASVHHEVHASAKTVEGVTTWTFSFPPTGEPVWIDGRRSSETHYRAIGGYIQTVDGPRRLSLQGEFAIRHAVEPTPPASWGVPTSSRRWLTRAGLSRLVDQLGGELVATNLSRDQAIDRICGLVVQDIVDAWRRVERVWQEGVPDALFGEFSPKNRADTRRGDGARPGLSAE